MFRISRLPQLLLVVTVLSDLSSSSNSLIFPVFGPPHTLISPQTPVPSVILPPVSHPRVPVAEPQILLPAVSRRQGEQLPLDLSKEKEPTCAELKAMWRKMRRISRQMEITNEIPRLQDPFVASAYSYSPSKYPDANPYSLVKSSKYKVFQTPNAAFDIVGSHQKSREKAVPNSRNFGKIIRNPDEHRFYGSAKDKMSGTGIVKTGRPHLGFDNFNDDIQETTYRARGRVPGRFSNSPLPEESLGVYGTVVHTPEERARFRSGSRRHSDPRFRTRLVGVSSGPIGRVPFRATKPHGGYHYGSVVTHMPAERAAASRRFSAKNPAGTRQSLIGYGEYPTEIGQRTSGSPTRVERVDRIAYSEKLKNSCLRVQNKTCKNDVECFCIGSPKLFCGGNRCRPKYKALKYGRPEKLERTFLINPNDINLLDYGFKMDPLWPAPF